MHPTLRRLAACVALSALAAPAAVAQPIPAQRAPTAPAPRATRAFTPPPLPAELADRARTIADEARLLRYFPLDLTWGLR